MAAGRSTVLDEVTEGEAALGWRADTSNSDSKVSPGKRITGICIVWINIKEEGGKVADVSRRGSNVGTVPIRAHTNLETIWELAIHRPSPKTENATILKRDWRSHEPITEGSEVGAIE